MRVWSYSKIREYFLKEPSSRVALQDWFKRTQKTDWNNFAELKRTFNSADSVGNDRFAFNVKGNHYRLIAIVRFKKKVVLVRWLGSHKDYDKLKNIDRI
jgi:mRNA interferase HigB